MPLSTTQESYKENNIAQLLKDLDKYSGNRGENGPDTKSSDKEDLYLQFTELLLNLGKHQKSWDAFKTVVDASINQMKKDTAKLNTVVYNDLRKTGLETQEEKSARRSSGGAPGYFSVYEKSFAVLEGKKKSHPHKASDILDAMQEGPKTQRPTDIGQVKKQLKKLAGLGLVSEGYSNPK